MAEHVLKVRAGLVHLLGLLVTGAPRLGDVEAGAVAAGFGTAVSVISGGLGCVTGALVIARLLPEFRRQRSAEPASGAAREPAEPAATPCLRDDVS